MRRLGGRGRLPPAVLGVPHSGPRGGLIAMATNFPARGEGWTTDPRDAASEPGRPVLGEWPGQGVFRGIWSGGRRLDRRGARRLLAVLVTLMVAFSVAPV